MSVLKASNLQLASGERPIYMVFKYIPDMVRMEPRNIGVLLWHKGALGAKFLEKAPAFVESESAYAQWLDYWVKCVHSQELASPMLGGEPVPVTSPKFLEVMQEASRGNFYLAYGGEVLDEVGDHADALDYLFKQIVL